MMSKHWPQNTTQFLKLTGTEVPIIQAPMAGGPSSPALVSAVSNAGGLGSIGGGYLSPESLKAQILEVKSTTDKPFGVNLFITDPGKKEIPPGGQVAKLINDYADELGVELTGEVVPFPDFDEQIEVILENNIKVFSFTFGVPEKKYIERLKLNNTLVIGTATSVSEAVLLNKAGCDAVVAQGFEAGGHRGSFENKNNIPLVGGITLLPQIADAIDIPLIASGGIMDGRGMYASFALGASAVQLGTAFLTCDEAEVNQSWIDLIKDSKDTSSALNNAFTGKFARGLNNRFMKELKRYEDEIPEYPIQHQLTRELRARAKEMNNTDFMSFWAGQGSPMNRSTTAEKLIKILIEEYQDVNTKMSGINS